jgi:hypothetical protein
LLLILDAILSTFEARIEYDLCGGKSIPKMDTIKLKGKHSEIDLIAALDRSVEAAVALGISESELLSQLSHRMHDDMHNDMPGARSRAGVESPKVTYHADAGP